MLYALVVLVLLYMFHKDLHSLVDFVRNDFFGSFALTLKASAIEQHDEARKDLLAIARKRGLTVADDIKTDDLLALLKN